jgi:hypothetical protein
MSSAPPSSFDGTGAVSFACGGGGRAGVEAPVPAHEIPFSQKNLGLEITINDNLNMKYINLNDNLNMKYNRAQHTPTSGRTNISTMIEIID